MTIESSVALKLPAFWESHAAIWFAQADSQFALRQISDDATRFHHVVSVLNASTATRALSLIQNPPDTDKYGALKGLLLGVFTLTESARVRQLLELPELGDALPSERVDYMLALLGTHSSDFLFRELFLRQLPEQVRVALANSSITDPRDLAKEADKFFSATRHAGAAAWNPEPSADTPAPRPPPPPAEPAPLAATEPDATVGASTRADYVLLPCQVRAEGQDVPPTVHFWQAGK